MANLIDRVLLGGAFVASGLIHRKVTQVEHRVEHVEQLQEELAEHPQGPGPDAPSGMPLPTGYGIQVAGPGNEDIVIPICLPPGFELASLVIVPSFLPDGERAPEPIRPVAVAPVADDDPTGAPAPGPAPAERLDGGVRLVYGESQPYSAQLDQSPLPAPGEHEEPALREASGLREAPPLRDSVL
jgi:hypothetical protein